ncbi:BDN_1c_G0031270.mRNA.1.CDS.1 [Saccharomyces cerevisiae]|nr:BDN_1c_G0031270.mRNA.1.CDS.1 [Saccharomyces cerevisiae]CAI7298587.1 BDN_1c_G0031270.mRNA.1.CDS.1 [Saccharomyces cerevisiae]
MTLIFKIEALNGICGSDFHIAVGNWGPVPEKIKSLDAKIIGRVVKVGSNCHTGVKIGDRVGVGAQALACLSVNVAKVTTSNTVTNDPRFDYVDSLQGRLHFTKEALPPPT